MSELKKHRQAASLEALPLIVAVTGHRDLLASEVPSIRVRVKNLLEELKDRYSFSNLTVMSPLAEGADLLVAEVASELSLKLIVPLPKPKEKYLADFSCSNSKEKFEYYYNNAAEIIDLSYVIPDPPENIDAADWERDFPYVQLGAYLSAHCHILLAIWDGKPSLKLGGTAQVVRFHHDDIIPGITAKTVATQQMLVDDESDLVLHINCGRESAKKSSQPTPKPIDWAWYTKDKHTPRTKELPAQHELIFRRSEEFSRDATTFATTINEQGASLIDSESSSNLPDGIESIDRLFAIADWLAIHFQRKTLAILKATHVLAFFMGLMFILYSDFDSRVIFLVAFITFFGVICVAQFLAKHGAWHRKYQDYRTLAEGLRVQFYWASAGVRNAADVKWRNTYDSYLQSQDPEFGWIRNVMRAAGLKCDASNSLNSTSLAFVLKQWIGDAETGQLGYYNKEAKSRIKRHRLTNNLGKVSLATSILIVLFFLLFGSLISEELSIILTTAMGTMLLLFAVREGYAFATAENELIKRYEYMSGIFRNSERRIAEAESDDEKRQILLALGLSALNENSNWLLTHRERSIDKGEIWRMSS